uniref:Uncharacterized protein n=1 Tax=Avena sativa TaxID=4498 RepID=A0ACD5VT94_AVESA
MGNCLKLQRCAETWEDEDQWEFDMEEGKGPVAAEKTADQRVEVKIRVTKRQVQELLQKAGRDGNGAWTEKVLAELINSGTVCCDHPEVRGHWRPSLQSISEAGEP